MTRDRQTHFAKFKSFTENLVVDGWEGRGEKEGGSKWKMKNETRSVFYNDKNQTKIVSLTSSLTYGEPAV